MSLKKILYIDPISPSGHKLYNEILIKDILRYDTEVYTVAVEGYLSKLGINNSNFYTLLEIPKEYYIRLEKSNAIVSRLKLFLILKYIKKKINFETYDYVIFSSYEEISFLFSFMPKNCYLISHNNFSNLNSIIKKKLNKRLSLTQNLIVLSKKLQNKLSSIDIDTIYVSHGIPDKFLQNELYNIFEEKYYIKKYNFILFSPSATSSDNSILLEIESDLSFNDFLEKNKVLIIVKGSEKITNKNVFTITDYLDRDEYEFLFKRADAILINYGKDFKNRVSGVYYEAVANQKPVIVSSLFYQEVDPFDPYAYSFSTLNDLKTSITTLLNYEEGVQVLRKLENYEPNLMLKISR